VDPVPEPSLFRNSDSARNQTRDLWILQPETLTNGPKRLFLIIKHIQNRIFKDYTYLGIFSPCPETHFCTQKSIFKFRLTAYVVGGSKQL
jgi:hypothetical protein